MTKSVITLGPDQALLWEQSDLGNIVYDKGCEICK